MKKMYVASKKQNLFIWSACFIACFTIITLNSYYKAKEHPKAGKASYVAFVKNGFTLNQN